MEPQTIGVAPSSVPAPFNGPHFNFQIVRVSEPIVRFSPVYGPGLELAQNIKIFLNANGIYCETEPGSDEVKALRVATLSGKRFSVKTKLFILASGAIENARLLLLSRSRAQQGFGNERNLVGRFLMAHLAYTGGIVAFMSASTDPAMFYGRQLYMRDGRQLRYVRALSNRKNATRARSAKPAFGLRPHQRKENKRYQKTKRSRSIPGSIRHRKYQYANKTQGTR